MDRSHHGLCPFEELPAGLPAPPAGQGSHRCAASSAIFQVCPPSTPMGGVSPRQSVRSLVALGFHSVGDNRFSLRLLGPFLCLPFSKGQRGFL